MKTYWSDCEFPLVSFAFLLSFLLYSSAVAFLHLFLWSSLPLHDSEVSRRWLDLCDFLRVLSDNADRIPKQLWPVSCLESVQVPVYTLVPTKGFQLAECCADLILKFPFSVSQDSV